MSFCIGGLQKTSFLDYPGKIACIVFTPMCNFHCGYCHNPELFVKSEPVLTLPAFFEFLNSRKGKLDGVVVTGGEPTLQSGLYSFIEEIKNLGFSVKLDTNGSNPKILDSLLKVGLLDYVAMDIKAPLYKYRQITNSNIDMNSILESISLLLNSSIDYEFRTTVVKSQLSFEDFDEIAKLISGAKKYYLQKFIPSKILDNSLKNEVTYSDEEFYVICSHLKKNIDFVDFR